MSDYLFAYGTLRTGHAPEEISHAVEKLEHIGSATVRGVLYDFGRYPGAVLNPSSELTVAGVVLQLPDDPRFLAQLDQYEEFDPDSPETSQFLRVRETVTLESSRELQCWIYVYNRDTSAAPILKDGKFPSRKR
jgi:gamma-glutamylcyclotransferase (GGCT)/AIG2-like uncharacterized protein YtfP